MYARKTVELLSELISIGSVNPGAAPLEHDWQGEKRIAGFVADWLISNGLDARIDEYKPGRANVTALLEASGDAPTVLITAHMDTVDIAWENGDRFGPVVKDGRLYGLGACDDKATLAALMLAAAEAARSGKLTQNLLLVASSDEEFGFSGISRLIATGVRPDCAIACEPTRLCIVRRHKAVNRWIIKTSGRSAHGSIPQSGENAIYKAASAVKALEAHANDLAGRPGADLLTPPTLNVGTIRGGLQANSVPDFCEIGIDRRLLPEEDSDQAEREILDCLKDAPGGSEGWKMEQTLYLPSLDTGAGEPIVKDMQRTCRTILGSERVIGVDYGTEAGALSAAGIPAVVFGAGDIAQAHAPDEFVSLEEVESATRVFTALVTETG